MNSSHKNKFNINISLNKNIIFNNNNHLFFISPTLSLQNIKHFLELYKTSEKNSIFSEKFINECPLYTKESQLPDSFSKWFDGGTFRSLRQYALFIMINFLNAMR